MAITPEKNSDRGYRIDALGELSLPPTAFAEYSSLTDLLDGRVNPRVMERLRKLASPDPSKKDRDLRQELLLRMLKATPATNVSFQERIFEEDPKEEDVISYTINEAGDVTILLG